MLPFDPAGLSQIKILLDQELPRGAANELRGASFDAIHVGELGMASATDGEILRLANEQDRIVVTLDADFHALLVTSGATSPSVIRIRIEGLRAVECANLIRQVVLLFADQLFGRLGRHRNTPQSSLSTPSALISCILRAAHAIGRLLPRLSSSHHPSNPLIFQTRWSRAGTDSSSAMWPGRRNRVPGHRPYMAPDL